MNRSWIRLLGLFGLIFILFGGFASIYFMDDKSLLPAAIAQLILGLICSGIYLFYFFTEAISTIWKNREKLLGVLGGVCVLVILIGVNVVSHSHWGEVKFDLTENKLYSLTDTSKNIVKNLKDPVEIVSFIADPRFRKLFESLATQYAYDSSIITYRTLDAKKDPRLLKQYEAVENQIVFHNTKTKKNVAIDAGLINEQEFTSALRRSVGEVGKKIYFLSGFGQPDLNDRKERGLYFAKFLLEREGFEVGSLDLINQPTLPEDAAALVHWGADRPLGPSEVKLLETFLASGGKVVIGQSPLFNVAQDDFIKSNLEPLMATYGLQFSESVVVQLRPNQEIRLKSSGQAEIITSGTRRLVRIVGTPGSHAIAQQLTGPFDFLFAQSVKELANFKSEKITRSTIAKSAPETILDPNAKNIVSGDQVTNQKVNSTGPHSLAYIAERSIDEKKKAGLVVFGSHEIAGNVMIQQGQNADLFLNTFNYLVDSKEALSIRPKSWKASTLEMEPAEQQRLYFASIFIVPMFIILFGLSVWNFRRSRA